jgi:hypothetical protein
MPSPINLSKATKLKGIVFRCGLLHSEWVAMALETITSQRRDLQRISIYVPHPLHYVYDEGTQWLHLDRLLVRFWDSRLIRPKVVYRRAMNGEKGMEDWIGRLLPEITKRGIIDLVEESSGPQ